MKNLANALGFQTLWFVCVLFGDVAALVGTCVYLILHYRYLQQSNKEFVLLFFFLLIGCIWDGALIRFGILEFPSEALLWGVLPPIWLLCLWVSVATMLAHCLRFLIGRHFLAMALGFLSPVLSYIGGAKLSGVEIGTPFWSSVFVIALGWAVILPAGFMLCQKLRLDQYR